MLTLQTNSANFLLRFFMLACVIYLGHYTYLRIMNGPNDEHILFSITTLHFEFKRIFILYFQILALFIVVLWVLFSLASINSTNGLFYHNLY